MENIVLIAVEKDKNENIILVFFNPNNNTVTFTDFNNHQRTVKVNRKIAKKYKHVKKHTIERFYQKLNKFTRVVDYTCAVLMIGILSWCVAESSRLVKEGVKYYKIEKSTEEDKIDYLTELINREIDKRETYTTEQKNYLKKQVREYFQITGIFYDHESVIAAEEQMRKSYITYDEFEEHILGTATGETGEITLYLKGNSWSWNTFLHENLHHLMKDQDSYLEECLNYSITDKLEDDGENLLINVSNQNLLLLSEIIGQDEVFRVIVNGYEEQLPQLIAQAAGVDREYASSVVQQIELVMERFCDNKIDEETFTLQENLTKELVKLVALTKNINYKDDFVLDALYNKEYIVDSFFMDDVVLKGTNGVLLQVQGDLDEADLLHIEARKIIKKLYDEYKAGIISEYDQLIFNEILTLCDASVISLADDMSFTNYYGKKESFEDLVISHIAKTYFPKNIVDADRFICNLYYAKDYQYNAIMVYSMLFEIKYQNEFTKEDVADIKKINDDILSIEGQEKYSENDLRVLRYSQATYLNLLGEMDNLIEKYPVEFLLLDSTNLKWKHKDLLQSMNSELIDEKDLYVYTDVFSKSLEGDIHYTYFKNPFSEYKNAKLIYNVKGEQKQSASRQTLEIDGELLEDVFIVDIDSDDPNTLNTRCYDIEWGAIVTVPYEEYIKKQKDIHLVKTISTYSTEK